MKPIIYIVVTFYIFLFFLSCNIADSSILSNDLLSGDNDSSGSGESGTTPIPNYYKNISEAISDGVIGYWKMNESSGSDVSDMTSSQNGTASNTSIIDGKFGKCRSFNGSNSSIDITGLVSSTQSYTIASWMYVLAASNCYYFDTGTGRFLVALSSGTIQVYNSTDNFQNYTVSPTIGEWKYVVHSLNNSTGNASLYIDGVNVGNVVSWTGKNIGGNTSIGCRYQFASQWYNGYLDDFAIWNRALTPTEILNIYNSNAELVAD